ncbi:hypothetical protein [Ferriphaselus amnicola]|uniref:hypothetical protein n=1 Tax=Ferriphaselus amnicola TaxID=1188319 RepID=UPI0011AE5741|nr:hypothetical protein [Ferriphaselus amnicola]
MKSIGPPSLTRTLEISLSPDRVRIVTPAGWRRAEVVLAELDCLLVEGKPLWQAATESLKQWLVEHPLPPGMRATINLSSHFIRYAMLPWSLNLAGRKEDQALGQILFEGIYGEIAKSWRISIASGGYGTPRVMAATEEGLLLSLEALLPRHKIKVIRPELAAIRVLQHAWPITSTQLAVIEPGLVLSIGIHNGQIDTIRRSLTGNDPTFDLHSLLQREALLNVYDPASVQLSYCLSDPTRPTPMRIQDGITRLELPSPSGWHAFRSGKLAALNFKHSAIQSRHIGWALLLLSAAMAAMLANQQTAMLEEAETIHAQLAARTPKKPPPITSPDAIAKQRKLEAINARLTFPWAGLLKGLESSVGENVVLLAVEPDPAGHQVKIEAEARDWDAMIEYVGKIDGEGIFAEAHLISHRVEKNEPQMPIRFVVGCSLK